MRKRENTTDVIEMRTIKMLFKRLAKLLGNTFLHNTLGFIVFLLILAILIYIPIMFLNIDIQHDEGTFMFMAKKILDGATPYKDFFDHKPPGIYYLYAILFVLFGKSLSSIRLGVFVFQLGTAVTVYFIGKEIKKEIIGKIASILFLIGVFTPITAGYIGQTEPFMIFFGTLGIFLYIKSKNGEKFWLVLLSGLFIGIATLFKQSAFLILLGLYMYFILGAWLKEKRNLVNLKHMLWQCSVLAIGVGFIWLPILYYFYIAGAYRDLIYAVFQYNTTEYASFSVLNMRTITYFWSAFKVYAPFWVFGIVAVLLIVYRFLLHKVYDITFLLVVLSCTLPTQLMVRQYRWYFFTIIPFFSILAAITIIDIFKYLKNGLAMKDSTPYRINKSIDDDSDRSVYILVVIIVVFLLGISVVNIYKEYPTKSVGYELALVKYIHEHTSPEEKIYIFGSAPGLYFILDRDPPSKYYFLLQWTASEEIQLDIINGLDNYRVRYVILKNHSYMIDKNGNALFGQTLYKYIKSNYMLEKSWGERSETKLWQVKWEIYRRSTPWN